MRNIYLFGEIDEMVAHDVVEKITNINQEDDEVEKEIESCKRPPINIIINSGGGSVYDGFAIIDAIRDSKSPIHTHAIGHCLSMALIIYLQGDYRSCGKYATFMNHESSLFLEGKVTGLKRDMDHLEFLDRMCEDIILDRTLIKRHQLEEWNNKLADQYLSSEVAYNYGICHEIR